MFDLQTKEASKSSEIIFLLEKLVNIHYSELNY